MKFTRLTIPDVILCEPEVFGDERGYFAETFRQDKLDAFLGFNINNFPPKYWMLPSNAIISNLVRLRI